MKIKDLEKIIKNCDTRIKQAKRMYKRAIREHCIFSQNAALHSIEVNQELKIKCSKKIEDLKK